MQKPVSHRLAASSYVVASASGVPSSAAALTGTYSVPVTSNIKLNTSSLVATMVLAGLNVGNVDSVTGLNQAALTGRNKKNALSTLSGIA